jgi:hypothetical protein
MSELLLGDSFHRVPLQDLTDDALIDWFAVLAHGNEDWSEFRDELKRRMNLPPATPKCSRAPRRREPEILSS